LFVISFDYTQTHTTVGRTPLDEGSARRRDLYLTTQTLYKRQTSIPPVGFEPTIPASTRPQTYTFDGATIGIGFAFVNCSKFCTVSSCGLRRQRPNFDCWCKCRGVVCKKAHPCKLVISYYSFTGAAIGRAWSLRYVHECSELLRRADRR
jgi:hypothetical protein